MRSGFGLRRRPLTVALTLGGLALGAALSTVVFAPAYLLSATESRGEAAAQAREAAEYGLGHVLGTQRINQFVGLAVGESRIVTAYPPGRVGRAEATITRDGERSFVIGVHGTDVSGDYEYQIVRSAVLTDEGVEIVPPPA